MVGTLVKSGVVDRSKFKGKLLFIDKKGDIRAVPMKGRRKRSKKR